MRKMISLILVLMLAFTSTVFASDYKIKNEKNFVSPRALLFENKDVGESDGHYVSTEFATPSSNSNNKGTSSVTVTLEKKGFFGGWSEVGSFTAAGKDPYEEMTGDSKTTYRIKVDSSSGARIKGHLRANQL